MERKVRDAFGWGIAGGTDVKNDIASAMIGRRFNQRPTTLISLIISSIFSIKIFLSSSVKKSPTGTLSPLEEITI